MANIVFVEQFYYPEGWGGAELPRSVTIDLASRGHNVTVICGSDQYVPQAVEERRTDDPTEFGVQIKRIPSLIRGNIRKYKLLRQLWFCALFLPVALTRRRPDLFITQTNPPLIPILVRIAAALKGKRYAIISQDIYPEMLAYFGVLSDTTMVYRFLDRLFGAAYRNASRVVSLGPVMRDRLLSKNVSAESIVEISNWATGDLEVDRSPQNPYLKRWQLKSKFVFFYSGNVGIGHEFETLINGFRAARTTNQSLSLVFVGSGARLEDVKSLVRSAGLSDAAAFYDFLPSDQLKYSMGVADIAVVTLDSRAAGLIVPSKVAGYMARGLPILYVGPQSDISALISDAQAGIVVANGDVSGASSAMLELARNEKLRIELASNAKRYYSSCLDKKQGLERYSRLVDSLVN